MLDCISPPFRAGLSDDVEALVLGITFCSWEEIRGAGVFVDGSEDGGLGRRTPGLLAIPSLSYARRSCLTPKRTSLRVQSLSILFWVPIKWMSGCPSRNSYLRYVNKYSFYTVNFVSRTSKKRVYTKHPPTPSSFRRYVFPMQTDLLQFPALALSSSLPQRRTLEDRASHCALHWGIQDDIYFLVT